MRLQDYKTQTMFFRTPVYSIRVIFFLSTISAITWHYYDVRAYGDCVCMGGRGVPTLDVNTSITRWKKNNACIFSEIELKLLIVTKQYIDKTTGYCEC